MPFLRGLSLQNFRGIARMKEPLRLRKFNLLIGKNNSGKSSILQSLFLFPNPQSILPLPYNTQKIDELTNRTRGGSRTALSALLHRYSGRAALEYETERGNLKIELAESGISANFGQRQIPVNDQEIGRNLFGTNDPNLAMRVSSFTSWVADIPISALGAHGVWETIEKGGAHVDIVRRFVNECVNDKFTEVLPRRNEFYLRKETPQGELYYISLSDMGEGVRRLATVLLYNAAVNPELLLWDDFDVFMHPSMTRIVLKYLDELECQVVASTHSIDALSQLAEHGAHDAQVILVSKDQNDTLSHKTLEIEQIEDLLEANSDPRKLAEMLSI